MEVTRRNALVGVHDKRSEFARRAVHEWTAEVFASDRQPLRSSTDPPEREGIFKLVAGPRKITERSVQIPLGTAGHPYRYYLLWITRLPPSGQAKVAEIYLFR